MGGWVILELQEATWCSAALVGVEQQPGGGAILTRETRAHGSLASDAKCLSLRRSTDNQLRAGMKPITRRKATGEGTRLFVENPWVLFQTSPLEFRLRG